VRAFKPAYSCELHRRTRFVNGDPKSSGCPGPGLCTRALLDCARQQECRHSGYKEAANTVLQCYRLSWPRTQLSIEHREPAVSRRLRMLDVAVAAIGSARMRAPRLSDGPLLLALSPARRCLHLTMERTPAPFEQHRHPCVIRRANDMLQLPLQQSA